MFQETLSLWLLTLSIVFDDVRVFSYSFVSVISIVETILVLFSPSLAGISSVPIEILCTFKSLMNRLLVISATSTAVVITRPRAFKVTYLAFDDDRLVMTART